MPTSSGRRIPINQRFAVQRAVKGAPSTRALRKWAAAAASGATEVTVRVVGTAEARSLNRLFRRRRYAPNVLSFPYGRRPWRGDIVLCHQVIAREARTQRKTLQAHYAHLVVHGMLHLRGYDHARPAAAARMEAIEVRLLRRMGYANPYETSQAVK